MDNDFLMKFFVTRWLVLTVLGFFFGLLVNGWTYSTKKEEEAYKGVGFWWLFGLVLATMHAGTFMYHKSFEHWAVCVGAGLMVGFCAVSLVRVIGGWLGVKMLRVYAVITALAFPLAIWLGGEKVLMDLFEKLSR